MRAGTGNDEAAPAEVGPDGPDPFVCVEGHDINDKQFGLGVQRDLQFSSHGVRAFVVVQDLDCDAAHASILPTYCGAGHDCQPTCPEGQVCRVCDTLLNCNPPRTATHRYSEILRVDGACPRAPQGQQS